MERREISVRVTLDREADAAYVYLAEEPELGWRHGESVPVLTGSGAMVNLDFDDEGRLMGVEVLGAFNTLPAAMAEKFTN